MLKLLAPVALLALFVAGLSADDKKVEDKKAEKPKVEDKKPAAKAGYIGIQIKHEDDKIMIQDVVGGSPAEKAGLMADDIVIKLNGKTYDNLMEFVEAVRAHKPGDKITVLVKRGDKETEIKITAGEAPPRPEEKDK